MKKIVTVLFTLILVFGIAVIPSYANLSDNDIVYELIDSDVIFETFSELGAVVESGDGMNIFMKIEDVYPFWIEKIQAIEAGTPYSYSSDCSDKIEASIVEDVLKKQVIYDNFFKLLEAERTGDKAKIFECVLKIYPDIVGAFVSSISEHNNSSFRVGTVLSNGGSEIVCGIGGIAAGFLGAWLIFRRKQKSTASGERK